MTVEQRQATKLYSKRKCQMAFNLPSELRINFKAACAYNREEMSQVIRNAMEEYVKAFRVVREKDLEDYKNRA